MSVELWDVHSLVANLMGKDRSLIGQNALKVAQSGNQ